MEKHNYWTQKPRKFSTILRYVYQQMRAHRVPQTGPPWIFSWGLVYANLPNNVDELLQKNCAEVQISPYIFRNCIDQCQAVDDEQLEYCFGPIIINVFSIKSEFLLDIFYIIM